MPASHGRSALKTRAWRRLRDVVRSTGAPCAICRQPIDYSLPGTHPMGFHGHHVIPPGHGGGELDPHNVVPAHNSCNARQRDNLTAPVRSREW